MHALIITVHILVCFALIGIVLLQQGKGAEMGAAFGGSSQTLFGSSGATTFLGKMTAAAAVVFMLTSLVLTYEATHRYKSSVMPESAPAAGSAAPAAPEQAAPATPQPATPPATAAPAAPEQAAAPAAKPEPAKEAPPAPPKAQ